MPEFKYTVQAEDSPRLDQVLASNIAELSRMQIKQLIIAGNASCNGIIIKSSKFKVKEGDILTLNYEQKIEITWQAQEIDLSIIYEDTDIIIINKPPGLVMHPGAGQIDQTLANALLYHNPNAESIPRAGIVHRLDKDTSGICICAKTNQAYQKIIADMQERKIIRKYNALVHGEIFAPGTISEAIGRHPKNRIAMAVTANGKHATTHFKILARYQNFTWLELSLETGRTHQIRVHMAHIKHPIAGDPLYNKPLKQYSNISPETYAAIANLKRQALHAFELSFAHPITGKQLTFYADVPEDISSLLITLNAKKI